MLLRSPLGLACAFATLHFGAAHAATITVQTLDAAHPTLCTLRDAAASVNMGTAQGACPAADAASPNTVLFDPALFATPGQRDMAISTPMTGSYPSAVHFEPRTALTLQGPGADALRLHCPGAPMLIGMTIQPPSGMAPDVTVSGLSIEDCSFGGLHVQDAGQAQARDLAVRDTTGVYAGAYFRARSVDVRQLTLTDNTTGSAHQAPLHIVADQTVRLDQILIQNNTGPVAGVLLEPLRSTRADVEISRLRVLNNTGTGTATAGALRADASGFALSDSVVANNVLRGGIAYPSAAVHIAGLGARLHNVTVSGNEGPMGAALTLQLSASTGPGAIDFDVDHVTVVNNRSTANGAVGPIAGPVGLWLNQNSGLSNRVRNSIVCGNQPTDLATADNTVFSHSLTGTWIAFANTGVPPTYTENCDAAALTSWLGPLGNHGGDTLVHPLLDVASSPAIDLGDPAYAGAATDQRGTGYPRVVNGRTDIGAHEFTRATSPTAVPTISAAALGLLTGLVGWVARRRRFRPAGSA